jgi:capsular polysaccharide biosynthesis protein
MDLRRQGQVVRSWLWLLIASLLLAGGAAYLVSSALPKVYESTVTLLVGQSSSSSTPNYNDLLASQRISQTYADLATTGTILGQVIAQRMPGSRSTSSAAA